MHSFPALKLFHGPYKATRPWALYLLSLSGQGGLVTHLVIEEEDRETVLPAQGWGAELSSQNLN